MKNITEKLDEMDSIAYEFSFHEQDFMKDELLRDIKKEYDFSYVKNQIDIYNGKIIKARKALEEERAINIEYDNVLKELEDCKNEKINSENRLESSNMLFSEIKEEFIENVYTWAKSNRELKPSKDTLIEVTRKINAYGEEVVLMISLERLEKYTIFMKEILISISINYLQKGINTQSSLKKKGEIEEW